MSPKSYILQYPNVNSEIKHYRTFVHNTNLLHDDNNTYKINLNDINTNEIIILHLN